MSQLPSSTVAPPGSEPRVRHSPKQRRGRASSRRRLPRRFHWRFFLSSLVVVLVLAGILERSRRYHRPAVAASWLAQARQAAAIGEDHTAAHRHYESYHRLMPDDAAVTLEWARLLDQPGARPGAQREAVTLYRELLLAQPGNAELHGRLADLLWQLGEPGPARAEAELAVRFDADSAHGQRVLALAAAQAAQLDAARWPDVLAMLRVSSARFPGDVVLASLLAGGLRRMSSDSPEQAGAEADQVMERLISSAGDRPLTWMARVVYRERFGLPGAETDLAEALRRAPEDRETLLAAGQRALAAGDGEQALGLFELAAAQGSASPRAILGMAWAWRALDQPERAVTTLEQGLIAVPNDPWLLLQLAEWQLERRNVTAAEAALEAVRRRLRQDPSPLVANRRPHLEEAATFLEGLVWLRRGQTGPALELLKPLLNQGEGAPNQRELQRQVQLRYALAACYGATRNFAQAARMFDDAARFEPSVVTHQVRAAEAWARSGRQDWAARRWSRAQSLDASLGQLPAEWGPRRPRPAVRRP